MHDPGAARAPHAYADFAGIPEHRIRVISPDIGGGFGNKVPIYPGYVCAIVGSMLTGRPVKWAEDRTENLTASGFARDYVMRGEIAATSDGRILAVRSHVLADHGAFNGTAAPMQFPGGFFGVFTGSYDLEAAYCSMTAVHTNKAPGGVAYACSFRIAEAVYLVERLVDLLADELGRRPGRAAAAELHPARAVPLHEPHRLGLRLRRLRDRDARGAADRGVRRAARASRPRSASAPESRAEPDGDRRLVLHRGRRRRAAQGPWTWPASAWPTAARCAIHPTGKAVVRLSVQTQGQGHETTFAQIVAEEIGIHPDDIDVVHGDTDNTPYGLGTYGSRSTPVSGAAAVLVTRKIRDKARLIAAHMLEVAPDDLEWSKGRVQRARRARRAGDDPGDRAAARTAPATCPTGSRAGWTRRSPTARAT